MIGAELLFFFQVPGSESVNPNDVFYQNCTNARHNTVVARALD